MTHLILIDKAQINMEIMGKKTFFPALVNYFSVSADVHLTGGFIGGLLGDIFAVFLGKVGSLLILLLINISVVILLTEQSLFNVIHKISLVMREAGKRMVEVGKSAMLHKEKGNKTKKQVAKKEDMFEKQKRH